MMIIFYFIWFLALVFCACMIDWTVSDWHYYNRWRKTLFLIHLFFLLFSVGLAMTMIIKESFGI